MDNISISVPAEAALLRIAAEALEKMAMALGAVTPEAATVFAQALETVVKEEAAATVPPPPAAVIPPPAPPAADLDVNGATWDERIHASSRAKLADGSWRMKRNLDPAVLAAVRSAAVPPPPPATSDVPPPPPAAASDGTTITTFVQLMKAIMAAKLERTTCNEAAASVGLTSFSLVATRPDLVPQIAALLGLV